MAQHAVLLGASKGAGYHALLRLLTPDSTWSATVLLRKPEVIEKDENFAPYINDGRLRIVQGDATNVEDVKKLFKDKTDVVISTVGALPSFGLTGLKIDQPKLCIDAAVALITVLQQLDYVPRVIVTSSMGIGSDHHNIPYVLQVLYKLMLSRPHQDKEGLEYLLRRSSSTLPTPPPSSIPAFLSANQYEGLKADFIPEVTIVRPALMTGTGDAKEQPKGPDKTKAGEGITTWTINRAEVGRFIVDECLPGKNEWVNKAPTVGW